jgi:regulator of nonsense transcripts 1
MVLLVKQNIFNAHHDPIFVDDLHEDDIVSPTVLLRFLHSAHGGTIGVAASYRSNCSLSCLAFATLTHALIVRFSAPEGKKKKNRQEQQPPVSKGRSLLGVHILCNPDIQLCGFRMDRIAVSLFLELELCINSAVDIQSVTLTDDRRSLQAVMNAFGDEDLQQKNLEALFTERQKKGPPAAADMALQAWAACRAATLSYGT